jgi:hypothetical protein
LAVLITQPHRMKLPQVMRNINEFNILYDHLNDYEIMYFGVNLILMLDYRLSFDIEIKNSGKEIDVLMIKRKDDTKWKNNEGYSEFKVYYINVL